MTLLIPHLSDVAQYYYSDLTMSNQVQVQIKGLLKNYDNFNLICIKQSVNNISIKPRKFLNAVWDIDIELWVKEANEEQIRHIY